MNDDRTQTPVKTTLEAISGQAQQSPRRPVEAGIHHQTAPKARIRQDNRHTMNIVRQYIANVHNTVQHACKLPPLGL
jgi:hypothetical protein